MASNRPLSTRVDDLLDVPFKFGLRAQGHIPTVERMLSEGASWSEIGRAIGWDGDTARDFYERFGSDE